MIFSAANSLSPFSRLAHNGDESPTAKKYDNGRKKANNYVACRPAVCFSRIFSRLKITLFIAIITYEQSKSKMCVRTKTNVGRNSARADAKWLFELKRLFYIKLNLNSVKAPYYRRRFYY